MPRRGTTRRWGRRSLSPPIRPARRASRASCLRRNSAGESRLRRHLSGRSGAPGKPAPTSCRRSFRPLSSIRLVNGLHRPGMNRLGYAAKNCRACRRTSRRCVESQVPIASASRARVRAMPRAVLLRAGAVLVRRPGHAGESRVQLLVAAEAPRLARRRRARARARRGRPAARGAAHRIRDRGRRPGAGDRQSPCVRARAGRRLRREPTRKTRRSASSTRRRSARSTSAGRASFAPSCIRLADDDHVLQIVVHHIVFDEWSKVVLYRELGALYAAFAEGRPVAAAGAARSSTPTSRSGSDRG